MSKLSEKPLRRSFSLVRFAFWVGLISGVLTLFIIATGIDDVPELLDRIFPNAATPTVGPPQQFLTGTTELLLERNKDFSLGFNFKLGRVATGFTPKDLSISNCKVTVITNILICDLNGKDIYGFGQASLDDILAVEKNPENVILGEPLEIGKAYALFAFDDHAVKFRISHLDITYENTMMVVITLIIDYVYNTGSGVTFIKKYPSWISCLATSYIYCCSTKQSASFKTLPPPTKRLAIHPHPGL